MKTIVAGSRSFDDYGLLKSVCDEFDITEVVSGTARGADRLGERYARENNIYVKRYPANWDKHGKAAGYIRNKEMAKYADRLIAFWDFKSKGTRHMIDLAEKENLEIKIVRV